MKSVMDTYRAMGTPARVGVLVGTVAILLCAAIALWWLFAPRDELLFGSLGEAEAAEIAAALDEWKVPHRFSDDGSAILVEGDQVHGTRMRLVSAGIPKGGHVGYELFDDNEFGVTEFAQRINYQRALQGELERTIAAIPGVRNVRVHLSIRRAGLFLGEGGESKASVAMALEPDIVLERKQVAGIRNLVASAVEGLKPESVVVVGPSGLQMGGGGTAAVSEGLADSGDSATEMAAALEAKIDQLLADALHGRRAAVSVNVRLNFDKVHKTSERLIVQPGADHGVVVRRSSNGAKPPEAGSEAIALSEQVEYAHGTEREEITRAIGVVERITVAVMLPAGVSSAEQERLTRLVAAAAGLESSRGDTIEVALAPAEKPEMPTKTTRENGAGSQALVRNGKAAEPGFSSGYAWMLLAWGIGLAMGMMVMAFRRRQPKLLSAGDSEAAVDRVRAWLADGAQ